MHYRRAAALDYVALDHDYACCERVVVVGMYPEDTKRLISDETSTMRKVGDKRQPCQNGDPDGKMGVTAMKRRGSARWKSFIAS